MAATQGTELKRQIGLYARQLLLDGGQIGTTGQRQLQRRALVVGDALLKVGDAQVALAADLAAIVVIQPSEQPQQGRFSGAVGADQP